MKDKKHEEYVKNLQGNEKTIDVNIDVNRNIFLGFEVKLSLKKDLEISK